MRNRSNRLRIILSFIFVVVAIVIYWRVNPDNLFDFDDETTVLSQFFEILFVLIVGIGIAQPIVDLVFTIFNTFFRKDRGLSDIREKILENQYRLWINGVLKKSIENDPLIVPYQEVKEIALNKSIESQHDVTFIDKEFREKIAGRLMKSSAKSGQSRRKIGGKSDQQKNIVDAYVASNEQLVIVGDGGSGKTIALLQLLEHLHKGVEEVTRNHIPVVFNLGTWDEKQLPLSEWIVSEILDSFPGGSPDGAARQIAYLLKRQQFILLFDGLDEISEFNRERFYSELWDFSKKAGNEPAKFVLCSRPEEFVETSNKISEQKNDSENSNNKKFLLNPKIIQLHPIDDKAIQQFLAGDYYEQIRALIFETESNGKRKSSGLRSSNKKRKTPFFNKLYDSAHHPFILNALAVGYKNPREHDIRNLEDALKSQSNGEQDFLPLVLQRYISQRFDNAEFGETGEFDEETTNKYLSWIASKLSEHSEDKKNGKESTTLIQTDITMNVGEGGYSRTSISVENLQSSWLDTLGWQLAYKIVSRMVSTAAITFGVGFFLASPLDYLVPGLLSGIVIGLIDFATTQSFYTKIFNEKNEAQSRIARLLVVYLSSSIVLSIFLGLSTKTEVGDTIYFGEIPVAAVSGITLAWFLSLFIALIYITQDIRLRLGDVALAEKIDFAYSVMIRYALIGSVTVGTFIAVFAQILQVNSNSTTTIWLNGIKNSTGISAPLVGFLAGAFFGGMFAGLFGLLSISSMEIERTRPNQGIQKSVINSFRVGLTLTLLFSVVFVVPLWYTYRTGNQEMYNSAVIYRALRNGLTFGILGALWSGGISTIHHVVLRFFIFLSGRSPWNISRFLRYCSEIHIMREVGASYIFGHNYIKDYYANYFMQTLPAKPRWSIAFSVLIMCVVGLVFGIFHQSVSNAMYSFRDPGQLEVSGMVSSQICVEKDDNITIRSQGVIRAGDYVGYVAPEGTEIGFWGIPIGDEFDYEETIANNALMCKLDSELKWHHCANSLETLFPFPWETRTFEFEAAQSGCLQFQINEQEEAKRKGAFFVLVEVTPKDELQNEQ